jgi:hypothetical protein
VSCVGVFDTSSSAISVAELVPDGIDCGLAMTFGKSRENRDDEWEEGRILKDIWKL